MRVALYARFSSDLQNARSAEDQLAALRIVAAAKGWTVTAEYADRGVSGAALANRPQIRALLGDAAARRFDLVMAEALDRVSRDQEDTAHVVKRLRFAGVELETLTEGRVGVLHVGVTGAMNQLFLEQLAHKTRRGLEARVRAGFSGGGRCYGYAIPAKGELAIDEAEAAVVRRVFAEYLAHGSPRSIARTLNAEGVPGPRGGAWSPSAILGDRRAGDGLLCQELYVGVRVFNRRRFRKDPDTGRRSSVLNPPEAWIREPVPQLRIVNQATWDAVQARQGAIAALPARARRPKRLLSGLLECATCGGGMTLAGGKFLCPNRWDRGTCTNGKRIDARTIEGRVIAGLEQRLLAPGAVAEAVRELHRDQADARAATAQARARAESELAEQERRRARAWEAWDDGLLEKDAFKARIAEIADRSKALQAELAELDAAEEPRPVRLIPAAAETFRAAVAALPWACDDLELGAEVRDCVRRLIDRVIFTPLPDHGRFDLEVVGQLRALLTPRNDKTPAVSGRGSRNSEVSLGAGAGFEPATFRL